jgi:hypothetical protein
MEELRSLIREAFDKEQAGHAPAAALRHNIVDAVAAQPKPARNLQWLAVAAAVLLAVLVVAGLMSTRFHPRASVPAATPNASPVADYGAPPAGVPLLYVHDPTHASWLIGFDWSGKPRGTVKLDPALASPGMAPNGQSFAVGFGAKGGTGEILDRLGKPIQGVGGALPGSTLPIWADDNLHRCGTRYDQGAGTLITLLPGDAVKSVITIPAGLAGSQSVVGLASCSFRNDQAILVRTTASGGPGEMWVVRISTGTILSHHTYPSSGDLANLSASEDGLLLAENSSKSTGQVGPNAASTVIRRVSDRSVVATLDPSMGVLAFNADDSLVLVTTTPWVGNQPTALAVIDLRSGQALWHYNGPDMFGGSVSQPGGRDFAITLRKPGVEDPLTDLMIVHADGTATNFPRRYQPTW